MNEPLDLTKATGETLAEALGQNFQLLIQTKNNIDMIQKELERRKAQPSTPPVQE